MPTHEPHQPRSARSADDTVDPPRTPDASADPRREGLRSLSYEDAAASLAPDASGGEAWAAVVAGERVLRQGASGPAVTRMQELLSAAGFSTAADGQFGPGTRDQIIDFQRSRELTADGLVGAGTAQALLEGRVTVWKDVQEGRAQLVEGSTGPAVKRLQKLLTEAGFPVAVNGQLGPTTAGLVRQFQTAQGMEATGRVDAELAQALDGGATHYGTDNHGAEIPLVERQGFLMRPPVAKAFDAMVEAAKAEGVTIEIKDGFRSFDQQVAIARRVGIYGRGGLAAVPGTSNHGLGRALDLYDHRNYRWLLNNHRQFGFERTVPGEAWHYEYWGS